MASESHSRGSRAFRGPSRQESLRVVGLTLETSGVRRAALWVDLDGVRVQTTTTWGTRNFAWQDLEIQARGLQAQRRHQRPAYAADPWSLARWSVLLRGAGALLDGLAPETCELHVAVPEHATPEGISLRALAAGAELFTEADVREHVLRLRMRHDARSYPHASPPQSSKRRWWPFGR
jgi:hypothetical protein